jgi:hypothetical protein
MSSPAALEEADAGGPEFARIGVVAQVRRLAVQQVAGDLPPRRATEKLVGAIPDEPVRFAQNNHLTFTTQAYLSLS